MYINKCRVASLHKINSWETHCKSTHHVYHLWSDVTHSPIHFRHDYECFGIRHVDNQSHQCSSAWLIHNMTCIDASIMTNSFLPHVIFNFRHPTTIQKQIPLCSLCITGGLKLRTPPWSRVGSKSGQQTCMPSWPNNEPSGRHHQQTSCHSRCNPCTSSSPSPLGVSHEVSIEELRFGSLAYSNSGLSELHHQWTACHSCCNVCMCTFSTPLGVFRDASILELRFGTLAYSSNGPSEIHHQGTSCHIRCNLCRCPTPSPLGVSHAASMLELPFGSLACSSNGLSELNHQGTSCHIRYTVCTWCPSPPPPPGASHAASMLEPRLHWNRLATTFSWCRTSRLPWPK